jgi:hypothetical protein
MQVVRIIVLLLFQYNYSDVNILYDCAPAAAQKLVPSGMEPLAVAWNNEVEM